METKPVPEAYDVLAPDGSEIRLLVSGERGHSKHHQAREIRYGMEACDVFCR